MSVGEVPDDDENKRVPRRDRGRGLRMLCAVVAAQPPAAAQPRAARDSAASADVQHCAAERGARRCRERARDDGRGRRAARVA